MTLEQILKPYFYTNKEDKKLLAKVIQAVKDRVKSKGLSFQEILDLAATAYPADRRHKETYRELILIAQAIHTEMDKAVEKL